MDKEIKLSAEEMEALEALSVQEDTSENDVEQLDELSIDTLKSYTKKSKQSQDSIKKDIKASGYTRDKGKTYTNRSVGQERAIRSAGKKVLEDISEPQWESMSDDEFESLVENFDLLSELSKKTLGSYIKKASHDVATKSAATGRYGDRANRVSDEIKKGDYSNWQQGKKDNATADKFFHKSWKRREGMAKAVDKLTKEDISETQWESMSDDEFNDLVENFELLSELSKKTLGSYVKKAHVDSSGNAMLSGIAMGVSKGEIKAAAKTLADKSIKRRANIEKAVDKLTKEEEMKEAIDPTTVKKDKKGISLSKNASDFDKKNKIKEDIFETDWEEMSDDEFESLVEDFEMLSELSKKTLGSYVKKATDRVRSGNMLAVHFNNVSDKSRNQYKKDAYRNAAEKEGNNAAKRQKGISKAVDKLTKEGFDMDEAIDPSTVKKDKKGISLSKNATTFDKKNKIKEDTDMNEGEFPLSQASTADNLKPNARPIDQPKSRLEVMKAVVGSLADMDDTSYTAFFNAVWPTIQKVHAGMDNSAANRATLKPANEEFTKLFTEDGLSEEFKEQARTLFETAVHLEVSMKTAELQEMYEEKLNEEIMNITEQVENEVNTYLDFNVEKFIKENALAIENNLKVKKAMKFVNEARALFSKYEIDLDEDEVSHIEDLEAKIAGLEDAVNEALSVNRELVETLNSYSKNKIIDEISEGLADTQKDRLKTLSEAISFENEETYKAKLKLVKDKFISEAVNVTGIELNEKVEIEEEKPKSSMSLYAQYIRK